MSYNWKIGMEALCIKTDTWDKTVAGRVYVVAAVSACRCGTLLAFRGVGFVNPGANSCACGQCKTRFKGVQYFRHERFRPATELELTMDRLEKEGCPTSLPEPVLG